MRCVSWNVNGLRAVLDKGFGDAVATLQPDVLLLQETRCHTDDLPADLPTLAGYRLRLHPAEQRGYSGVAIYARREPDEWIEGLGDARFDGEGRVLSARFGATLVTSVYFPNSQAKGARLDYRLAFGARFREFLRAQRARGRRVVVGGDFNVAHRPIDLARPAQNERNPGYLPEERAWFDEFLADGWVDTFRARHPDAAGCYTWWSFRHAARSKNIGWRLDYLCVDGDGAARVRDARIHAEIGGSDHCPIAIDIDAS